MTTYGSGVDGPTDGEDRRISAVEYAYQDLRRAILEGELSPGERLTGSMLTERLGVSRTPIRAALQKLAADGLVGTADGRAAWVRPLSASDVEQAYDVAQGLETILVVRLAEKASEAEVSHIVEAAEEMELAAAAGDKSRWVVADERFHRLLVEYGRNSLMASLMERVSLTVGRVRLLSLHLYPDGALQSAQDHHAVAQAIADREATEARDLHHDHWERARMRNLELLRASFQVLSPPPSSLSH